MRSSLLLSIVLLGSYSAFAQEAIEESSEEDTEVQVDAAGPNAFSLGASVVHFGNNLGTTGRLQLSYERFMGPREFFSIRPSAILPITSLGPSFAAGLAAQFWFGTRAPGYVRFKIGPTFETWWVPVSGVLTPYAFFGVETGIRVQITRMLFVDFPVEAGMMPGLSWGGGAIGIGMQAGAAF